MVVDRSAGSSRVSATSSLPASAVEDDRPSALDDRWAVPAILAIPFVAAIIALRGLTVRLPMFHGTDEFNYHYPTILRFSRELPFPDLASYHASQTPLFHLVMAYAGQVTGYTIWHLRLVEATISYLLALAVFHLLSDRLQMSRLQAIALSLLFVLSPYVYAASFRLMTDNLALLFSVVAIDRLVCFRKTQHLGPFIVGAACAGAALLTRQSTIFLFAVAGICALQTRGLTRRGIALSSLALCALPACLLFLTWHGLTPPGGDTSSCGLCGHHGLGGIGLRVAPAELTLAVIGLYGAVLFAPVFPWRDRRALRRSAPRAAACAMAAAVLLIAFPASPDIHPAGVTTTAGVLWTIATHTPMLAGTPLLFWILVPLAGAVLSWRLGMTPQRWLLIVFLGCFLLASLVIRLAWQKYVDPYALLALMTTARPRELATAKHLTGAGVLTLGSLAYTLSFVI